MGEGRGAAVGVGQVVSPVLVGRESELSVLVAAVESLPAVAVVEGEAGIGKSRLVAELAAHPVAEGRQWLAGASRRVREPFPLGPVLEALRGVRKGLDRRQLSPVSGALRGLLPELAKVLPAAPEPLGDPAAERHRVYRALAEVFAALGDTVLVIEDLHWADEQTADFLAFLVADPPARLAVLVTYRPAEAAAGPCHHRQPGLPHARRRTRHQGDHLRQQRRRAGHAVAHLVAARPGRRAARRAVDGLDGDRARARDGDRDGHPPRRRPGLRRVRRWCRGAGGRRPADHSGLRPPGLPRSAG